MIIDDAIRSAPTEHAVYLLVTAYIESLCHFEASAGVPKALLMLPLRGAADLAARLNTLEETIDMPLEAVVPASEVVGVLASALRRLGSLGAGGAIADQPLLSAA